MDNEDTVRFTIAVADQDAAIASRADAEKNGATDLDVDPQGAGILPIVAFAVALHGVMAIGAFSAWLAKKILDYDQKGVLIRIPAKGEIQVSELPIPYGQVVVIGPDGTWTKYYDVDTDDKMTAFTKDLLSGVTPAGGTPTSEAEVEAETEGEAEAKTPEQP